MTKEERELAIPYLEDIKESYVDGNGYERHPLPEYYAIEAAIKALEQEPVLDKIYADIQRLRGCSCSYSDGIIDDIEDILDKYKENYALMKLDEHKDTCKWIHYNYRTVCPKEHDIDNPYWRIPENRMDTLQYCPYCGKKMELEVES